MPTTYPKRGCPICGRVAAKLIYSQYFEQPSHVQLMSGYDVVVCNHCGLGYAEHIPPQAAFDEYYRRLSKYEYGHRAGVVSASDDQRFKDIAAGIRDFIPAGTSRVLEIGCATGRLLSFLKEDGFGNVFGLDPSRSCVETAKALYGLDVSQGSVFDMATPDHPYDFVILIGVIEHIRDIRPALNSIRAVMSASGRLYLEVPDVDQFSVNAGAPYQEFSIEHINFFSVRSLSNLAAMCGFRTLATGCGMRPQHEISAPAAFGIYEACGDRAGFIPDMETEPALLRYVCESEVVDSGVMRAIGSCGANPIIVWGVGSHTQRLLAAGAFARVNVVAFVDSDPKHQGQTLRGLPILAPLELNSRVEPILVSSRDYQREIERQITQDLGLRNEVILLYQD